MSDNKSKVGKPDRDRVAAGESYEVGHLATKHGLPRAVVVKVIAEVGPMRVDVEKRLAEMKTS